MNKKIVILLLCILSSTSFLNARSAKQVLLRDGLILRGTAGKLIGPDSNDTWFFELNSPISDNNVTVKEGEKLELLPSSVLEMMVEDVKTHTPASYQLWNAKITKYKGKNYIFPSVFIRVRPMAEVQPSEKAKEKDDKSKNAVNSNDSSFLPPDIAEKLNTARQDFDKTGQRIADSNIVTIDTIKQELEKIRQSNPDKVLIEEIGILGETEKNGTTFTFDSIGRNIDFTTFRLLPCEALEQAQVRQSQSPDPVHFKVSGLITKYKGNNYLFLYKAAQLYSQGNFGN
jgi:hypothetical protein